MPTERANLKVIESLSEPTLHGLLSDKSWSFLPESPGRGVTVQYQFLKDPEIYHVRSILLIRVIPNNE